MGTLSSHRLSVMKWRTAFIALGVLGLFTYGPSFRSEHKQGRLGRQLLEEGEGSGYHPGVDITDGDTDLETPTDTKPSCDLLLEQFKSQLKVYMKAQDDPASVHITCDAGKTVTEGYCKDGSDNWYTDVTSLDLTFDDCRSINITCVSSYVTYEPDPPVDPMFPPDAFTEEQRGSGAIILHVIGILYMFYALALVCDHYFVPTLDVVIEKFGISPDVAGATFMAAGGSAPELFTSVIGVFIAVSDVGIGTIVGSAVFNVLFVIAACAFASAEALQLTAWPLIRDTTFYSIALIVLVIFFNDDLIKWWEALILFLWYFAYVIFMKFNESVENKFLETFPSLKKAEEETETGASQKLHAGFKFNPGRKPLLELMKQKVESTGEEGTEMKGGVSVGLEGLKVKLQDGGTTEEEGEKLNPKSEEKVEDGEKGDEGEEEYVDYIRSGPEGGIVSKIMWYISFPLMALMWITIPDPQDPKRKKFFPVSFLISIIWIAIYSYFMVWWATLAGQTMGISDAVMGLTFLAAGTSVPDLITSVLVAKEGKGDMAVSSSIGSNLFDVTVGLPLPWLLYTAINQKAMEVNSVGMGCSIAMLFVMLIAVFVSIIVFKWKMTKPMGGIMLVLYCVFVVVSLGLSECWFVCKI